MNLKVVTLNNSEYYVMNEIKIEEKKYYILLNTTNRTDLQVRKVVKENDKEYLQGLDNETEFDQVISKFNYKELIS